MDIVYGVDAQRKRMKRRAVTEVFYEPGMLLADLIIFLNDLFKREDAEEVLYELCEINIFALSAEGGLYLQTNWTPSPNDEINP